MSSSGSSAFPEKEEKIKIRILAESAGFFFYLWGGAVLLTGLHHAFFGEPEANFYSLQKWQFVTEQEWLLWSGFLIAYGLCCLGFGKLAQEVAKRLPVFVIRRKEFDSQIL